MFSRAVFLLAFAAQGGLIPKPGGQPGSLPALATPPSSDAETIALIEEVLAQRHPTDGAEWWRSLGSGAPAVILKMLDDTKDTHRRARLVMALAWFDTKETTEFLREEASRAANQVERNAAIMTLGRSQGTEAVDFIAGFLRHPDDQTKLVAAETLQAMKDPHAEELLAPFRRRMAGGWLGERLAGRLPGAPKAAEPRSIVPSPAPRAVALTGQWRGFWLESARGPRGMLSIPALARFEDSADGLRAELKIRGRSARARHDLTSIRMEPVPAPSPGLLAAPGARADSPNRVSANLVETRADGAKAESAWAGHAEGDLLVLRSARYSAVLVLRKE